MSSVDVFWKIGDLAEWTFGFFEISGNFFNDSFLILGFIGLFYWLNVQRKFNNAAEGDKDQLK